LDGGFEIGAGKKTRFNFRRTAIALPDSGLGDEVDLEAILMGTGWKVR
jgi:hypothetical protein